MILPADTIYDTSIGNLIAEMLPALEYTLADAYLSDTGNLNLQAALNLGMLEIISGEFLHQLSREMRCDKEFSVGGLALEEIGERGRELIKQGASRLAPFLRTVR